MRTLETVTCAEMKEIEKRTDESGLSYYSMMENAGNAAARTIQRLYRLTGKRALIFCGKGNNGGDGFVVARVLSRAGMRVTVLLVDGSPQTYNAARSLALIQSPHIRICSVTDAFLDPHSPDLSRLSKEGDLIVDAIYGTGFHGDFAPHIVTVAAAINTTKSIIPIVSLDIPSGLNGDSGQADPYTIRADHTIAFHRPKPAHVLPEAAIYCGQVITVDIGIPADISPKG